MSYCGLPQFITENIGILKPETWHLTSCCLCRGELTCVYEIFIVPHMGKKMCRSFGFVAMPEYGGASGAHDSPGALAL